MKDNATSTIECMGIWNASIAVVYHWKGKNNSFT